MESLGSRIKEIRESQGVSQAELGRRIGQGDGSAAYISRVEHDRVVPSLRTVRRFAEALGVSVTELLV